MLQKLGERMLDMLDFARRAGNEDGEYISMGLSVLSNITGIDEPSRDDIRTWACLVAG